MNQTETETETTKRFKFLDLPPSHRGKKAIRHPIQPVFELNKTKENLENALAELREIKTALDRSSIVSITDTKGVITYANAQFCNISQYSREELVGATHQIVASGYHSRGFFSDLWKTISGGETWVGEIKNRAKDGSFYWVHTTIVPFFDGQDQPYQYVSIRNDITKKKRQEEIIRLDREKLREGEKMSALGVMAAGIAHELGNPLATLTGRSELLELILKSPSISRIEALETNQAIMESAQRMSAIIRGLRTLSREGSKDPFSLIDLKESLLSVIALSKDRFKQSDVNLTFDLPVNPVLVDCREGQIAQIVLNLLNNACDAVHQQTDRWTKIDLKESDEEVTISITDSGNGISEGIREKIMMPFFTTKQPGKGTGLGLSISKSLVEAHHGTLSINPSSPHTQFLVHLPKKQRLHRPIQNS